MASFERYEGAVPRARDAEVLSAFLRGVYGWMCGGLAITAATAWLVASTPGVARAIITNPILFWGLAIAQIGIVFTLSARVNRMASGTASALFILYSALTGVTLSFVLLLYTGQSVATTFLVAGGMFGSLALYGTVTKRSLSGFGQFLFMGVVGLLLASLVGMFWHNDGLQFMISLIGVLVFSGADRLRRSAPEGHGLCDEHRFDVGRDNRRRARALSRLHQPVPVSASLPRQPPRRLELGSF